MTGAGEGKGEIDGYGGFTDTAFGGGDGDGFADGGNRALLGETALHAGELWGSAGARETLGREV